MQYLIILLIALFSCFNSIANACTDFRVIAKDGSVLVTRSMEFALDLQSNLCTSNRGRMFTTLAPNGKPGMQWKAKYGYVFLNALNVDVAMDGMNEKGLSFEALYLPGLAAYQQVPAGQENYALPYLSLGDWVLGNFQTVDEVKNALKKIYAFPQTQPQTGTIIFPLHFAIYEASGKGIVVEYVNGVLNIYENKIGVMTNSPSYAWHITNLGNYVHLQPENPHPIVDNNLTFAANGQGFGMLGLPGDISPPSRFVKIATLLAVVLPVNNAIEALNLAEHIINNVDIPRGLAREPNNGNITNEITQWVVFKDLTHKNFYYRTYVDLSLHRVALSKLDFSENAPRLKMPIVSPAVIQDASDKFLTSKM